MKLRIALLQDDRPGDQFERGIVLAALVGEDAETVKRVRMIGVERKTVAIEAFGLREPS